MKEAYIPYVEEPIDWSRIPSLPIAEHVRLRETSAKAFGQICYSATALHIRLTAFEPEIRKEESGPLCMPCRDSCLEFFFCPDEQDLRYFNFEFNPKGCMYLGFGTGPADLIRLVLSEAKQQAWFSPVTEEKADSWSVSFRVPYTFVRQFFPDFSVKTPKAIRGNFYKCGDSLEQPHFLAWNKITREGVGLFHTPSQFGRLYLEKT